MFIWSPVEQLSGSHVQIFMKHYSKFLEYGSKNRESIFCQGLASYMNWVGVQGYIMKGLTS